MECDGSLMLTRHSDITSECRNDQSLSLWSTRHTTTMQGLEFSMVIHGFPPLVTGIIWDYCGNFQALMLPQNISNIEEIKNTLTRMSNSCYRLEVILMREILKACSQSLQCHANFSMGYAAGNGAKNNIRVHT